MLTAIDNFAKALNCIMVLCFAIANLFDNIDRLLFSGLMSFQRYFIKTFDIWKVSVGKYACKTAEQ